MSALITPSPEAYFRAIVGDSLIEKFAAHIPQAACENSKHAFIKQRGNTMQLERAEDLPLACRLLITYAAWAVESLDDWALAYRDKPIANVGFTLARRLMDAHREDYPRWIVDLLQIRTGRELRGAGAVLNPVLPRLTEHARSADFNIVVVRQLGIGAVRGCVPPTRTGPASVDGQAERQAEA